MIQKRKIAGFAVLTLALISSAQAAYPLGVSLKLAPPPRPGSAVEKADFVELHRLQDSRSADECDAAAEQAHMDARTLFGPSIRILSREEFKAVEPLLEEVLETVSKEAKVFKVMYDRKRPYVTDPTLHPCVPLPGPKSYPSAHAASGIVLGKVLEVLFPKRSTAIEEEAMRIGDNRLIGGVHHPSDIVAGRDLGNQIWNALETNGEFNHDLEKARRDLKEQSR